jgi:hypothetical protein
MNNTLFAIAAILVVIGILVFSKSIHSDDGVGVAEGVGFAVAGIGFYVVLGLT